MTLDLLQLAGEVVADMFADSELRKHRLTCECEKPAPGQFSVLYWTTCQKCDRQLSYLACVERGVR